MQENEEYLKRAIDTLKELSNIGTGHAVTALSRIIKDDITMEVPKINLVKFQELHTLFGSGEMTVAAAISEIEGDIEGMIMFVTDIPTTRLLASTILNKPQPTGHLTEVEEMVLQGVGNILFTSYLTPLTQMINMKATHTKPYVCVDMVAAIMSVPAVVFGEVFDYAMIIQSVFKASKMDLSGYIVLVPSIKSMNEMMNLLGVK